MAQTAFLSFRTAAGRLSVSESTVRNWFDRNVISGVRLPTGVRRIPVSEVERLERQMFAPPTSFASNEVNASPSVSRVELPREVYPNI
jgi:excisionase family DNA binding protein